MSRAAGTSVVGRIPRLLITIVLVWSAGGWLVGIIARALPGASGQARRRRRRRHGADEHSGGSRARAGVGRTNRALPGVGVAALSGARRRGGVKLLVEDLPRSRPATLFIALALYGGALIVAPRLGRTGASSVSRNSTPT